MDILRAIIAHNIASLRLASRMTQQELGNKLNYTDKAVSKWERAESVPDVSVLSRIAKLFGVTVDYLITDHSTETETETEAEVEAAVEAAANTAVVSTEPSTSNTSKAGQPSQVYVNNLAALVGYEPHHLIITLMSTVLVWLLAVAAFVCISMFAPDVNSKWLCFVVAVPVSAIVLLVLNSIWGPVRHNFTIISILLWSILGTSYLFTIEQRYWVLFLIGVPSQIIILLWSRLSKKRGH